MTITKWTNWLVNKGYVEIVKKGNSYHNKNTEYKIPILNNNINLNINILTVKINDFTKLDINRIYRIVIL